MEVKNFPEQEILQYLGRCQEQRTGKRAKNYSLREVALSFGIITEEGVKHIYLGDINESGMGYGSVLYKILEPPRDAERVAGTHEFTKDTLTKRRLSPLVRTADVVYQ